MVIKKLKDMGLISGAKDLAKTKNIGPSKIRPPKEWANNEIVELQRIFEEVRHSTGKLLCVELVFTISFYPKRWYLGKHSFLVCFRNCLTKGYKTEGLETRFRGNSCVLIE